MIGDQPPTTNATPVVVIVYYNEMASSNSDLPSQKFKTAPDDFYWLRQEMAQQRVRFIELARILTGEAKLLLRNFNRSHLAAAVIFQPCWSRRRWKSLT